MCKGKKWKNYLFKVTGSTYLHYFDENKVTECVCTPLKNAQCACQLVLIYIYKRHSQTDNVDIYYLLTF